MKSEDFDTFDLVLAMDQRNFNDLLQVAGPERAEKVKLFLEFAPSLDETEIPDPYYGGEDGFERVFSMLHHASAGLADHIQRNR